MAPGVSPPAFRPTTCEPRLSAANPIAEDIVGLVREEATCEGGLVGGAMGANPLGRFVGVAEVPAGGAPICGSRPDRFMTGEICSAGRETGGCAWNPVAEIGGRPCCWNLDEDRPGPIAPKSRAGPGPGAGLMGP